MEKSALKKISTRGKYKHFRHYHNPCNAYLAARYEFGDLNQNNPCPTFSSRTEEGKEAADYNHDQGENQANLTPYVGSNPKQRMPSATLE
mmetsp:Transcript_15964/g.33000  ORF Transcript_15964/g.33000 Transcript_15964/m.33000 type:complete len:90 (-) Transcript_15964:154-423(-)